ncbi:PAS domain S-box protein [Marinoscillum sp. MHG1-6]|uniref:PAS domain S-box protein n=1 Tax=Marinoscillum sp. MHG1-6 TaxID=2959627 RepID=UPI002157AB1F|nr:PAS domain S-box protein [Marinoscillum sp. MHG1-6]
MNILYLEDNKDDFELLDRILKRSDLKYTLANVSSRDQFEQTDLSGFDIILSDYNLKGFTGFDALQMVRAQEINVPFIVISGTVGEEQAVSLLHEGASDFLLKKNIRKLPIILEQALKNTLIAEERRNFQKELINKNIILDSLFHSFEDLVFLKDTNSRYLKVNDAFCKFFGYPEKAILGAIDQDIMESNYTTQVMDTDTHVVNNKKSITYEATLTSASGKVYTMEVVKSPVLNEGKVTGVVGCARDVTIRKQLEEKEARNQYNLNQAEKLTNSGSFEYDPEFDTLTCSPNFLKMMGLSTNSNVISLNRFINLVYKKDQKLFTDQIYDALEQRIPCTLDHRFVPLNSDKIKFGRTTLNLDITTHENILFHGTTVDITTDQESSRAMIDIQEKERTNIARELHDNLGQKLSASCLFLDSLSNKYSDDSELKKVKSIIEQSLHEVRALSSNLSLNIIKQFGLKDSVRQLGSQIPENIDFDFDASVDDDSISEFIGIQAFRIIQECISNALKHSSAKRIGVQLVQDNSVLSLRVEDNGKGFEANNGHIGNGLQNLQQRVKRCNGLIHIASEKGKGTHVDIKLPIN